MKWILLITMLVASKTQAALGDRILTAAPVGVQKIASAVQIVEAEEEGRTIRQFINADGFVFGIAWNGLTHPDLNKWLGTYFLQYDQAAKSAAKPGGRAPVEIKTDSVVVVKAGRMRDNRGSAYLPALVPTTFDLAELQ